MIVSRLGLREQQRKQASFNEEGNLWMAARPRIERSRKGPTGRWKTARSTPDVSGDSGEELGERARKTSVGVVLLRTVLESTLELPAAEG